jgi:predicted acyltransferase
MAEEKKKKSERLISLDALRGFDMFWIMGGNKLIIGLSALTGWPLFEWLAKHMEHVQWEGFQFYDLIFPLFLFIAGVSMPFSIWKRKERGDDTRQIYYHMLKRLVLLVIFGMIHNRVHWFQEGHIRFASVLARIGFGWFFAALIVMNSRKVFHYVWLVGILLGYWAIMALIPAPGYEAGDFSLEGNLAGYIDRLLLPGSLIWDGGYLDPEGILSTIPAVATGLLGVITGHFLRDEYKKLTKFHKGIIMALAGGVLMGLGALWGLSFPIIKKLWTSSFVLYAGGISLILLSIFYIIIDVWGKKQWAFFFVVIGLNSILSYMMQPMLGMHCIKDFIALGFVDLAPENLKILVDAIFYVVVCWTVLYFFYKKKIFLKV